MENCSTPDGDISEAFRNMKITCNNKNDKDYNYYKSKVLKAMKTIRDKRKYPIRDIRKWPYTDLVYQQILKEEACNIDHDYIEDIINELTISGETENSYSKDQDSIFIVPKETIADEITDVEQNKENSTTMPSETDKHSENIKQNSIIISNENDKHSEIVSAQKIQNHNINLNSTTTPPINVATPNLHMEKETSNCKSIQYNIDKIESKISVLKSHVNCELSNLNTKLVTISNTFESLSNSIADHQNESNKNNYLNEIAFLRNEITSKNDTIKVLLETQTSLLETILHLNKKSKDLHHLYTTTQLQNTEEIQIPSKQNNKQLSEYKQIQEHQNEKQQQQQKQKQIQEQKQKQNQDYQKQNQDSQPQSHQEQTHNIDSSKKQTKDKKAIANQEINNNSKKRKNKKQSKNQQKLDNTSIVVEANESLNSISENKEHKISENVGNNEKDKQNIVIIGDSMVKGLKSWKMNKSLGYKHKVNIRTFAGAKINCMRDYVKPINREMNPNHLIIHVGTNNLNSEATSSQIAKSIIELAVTLKKSENQVTISGIIPRNDNLNNKGQDVNLRLERMCLERNIPFITHSDTIRPDSHINNSKIHLNSYGDSQLARNFVNFIKKLA